MSSWRSALPTAPRQSWSWVAVWALPTRAAWPDIGDRHPQWPPATSPMATSNFTRLAEDHCCAGRGLRGAPGAPGGMGLVHPGNARGDAPGPSQPAVTPPFIGKGPPLREVLTRPCGLDTRSQARLSVLIRRARPIFLVTGTKRRFGEGVPGKQLAAGPDQMIGGL